MRWATPVKKTLKASEQNRPDVQEAREAFVERAYSVDPRRLVFLDEFGCNTAMARRFARALKGQRAYGSCPINYGDNQSVVGAIRMDGVVTAMRLAGAMDGEAFLAFVREFLAPSLRAGDVVVMDNLGAHKVHGVREAIEAVGASVLYLPPYSPEFNPIELCWSKLKEFLRSQATRTVEALDRALAQGFDRIHWRDLLGWFKHCGYIQST